MSTEGDPTRFSYVTSITSNFSSIYLSNPAFSYPSNSLYCLITFFSFSLLKFYGFFLQQRTMIIMLPMTKTAMAGYKMNSRLSPSSSVVISALGIGVTLGFSSSSSFVVVSFLGSG